MPRLPKHDPLDVPATRAEINEWRYQKERAQVQVDYYTYDADPESLRRMWLVATFHNWDAAPVEWKLANNDTLVFTKKERFDRVRALLEKATYENMKAVHEAAQRFKQQGATKRQLKDWKP